MGDVGDRHRLVGLRAVRRDRGAVVAEVDVGLEACDPLTRDAGALQAADELFALAGEHGAGDHFDAADFSAAKSCRVHAKHPTRNHAVDFAYLLSDFANLVFDSRARS